MKAREDFFTVVLYVHVMAAVKQLIAKNSSLTCIDVDRYLISKYISLSISVLNNTAGKGNDYGCFRCCQFGTNMS